MKELRFTYRMRLSFVPPVRQHRFTLKSIPHSSERQEISDLSVEIYPNEFLSSGEDSFGNTTVYGYAEGTHDHFSALISGRARTGLSSGETARRDYQLGMYRYQTDYTLPGPSIRAFADTVSPAPKACCLETALQYMEALHAQFRYVQGVTDITTTAEQAMAQGMGVCQDYAHILLSLCRIRRIPSRYVVGMLTGEGLSHAWVEVCSGGQWIALDPTNNLIVDDAHIKLSSGRDYRDCTVNQGVFVGQTRQTQEISVKVWEEHHD